MEPYALYGIELRYLGYDDLRSRLISETIGFVVQPEETLNGSGTIYTMDFVTKLPKSSQGAPFEALYGRKNVVRLFVGLRLEKFNSPVQR
ncbi:hypothetical protein Tco_0448880 [Tanacetum coccineum]